MTTEADSFYKSNPSTVGLNVSEAAQYVGMSISFMNRARLSGTGATYLKLGRRVVYERSALDNWLASSRRTSTSSASAR